MRVVVYLLAFILSCSFSVATHASDGFNLPDAFTLELHVGSEGGAPLSGALGLNEELFVSAKVPQLGRSGGSVLANVIWQLYTVSGDPVPEFNKTRQIIGLGNQEFCSFRIRSGELANGMYFVGLTHQDASEPTTFYQASAPFEVYQPFAIKEIVIDESPRGKINLRILYEDQSPHIFVYYYLAEDVYTALVQIDVVDEFGKVRASRTLYKDKDFTRKRERVGIKLPPGLFKAGEKATVLVSLSTSDDITVRATSAFEILALDLGVNIPDSMIQGTVADFQLFAPQTFTPPYTLKFKPIDGFIFKYEKGGLAGKLFVTPVAAIQKHNVEVTVVDQNGNRAQGSTIVEVVQGTAKPYQSKQTRNPNLSQQGGRIGSSTRR